MSQLLAWELNETTLYLTGTLDRDSLMSFWDKKDSSLERIENIDVSGLKHVDSTGLAMLVRLKGEFQAKNRSLNITGVSDNLNTLIELYGVQGVILN
ncbi:MULTISPECIES: lipid asymmetry maintenance protein MlaB [Providencia]|uniref:Lipid asymmetry maintenance protein MlaB n=1 Tax=Providencia rettgeri TaxID=587 RepID=A0A1B8SY57_PRORE|nr:MULTISPECIES: lipid asymmetry maintenance protein MlaB [Providencia]AWS50569.1 lipid asymmetry maintenance protein MlaB [Providencia rettgeri]EHZ7762267.1 lipid asymmetry maintenance protein MlaB [Providencia rettgeri]EIJ7165409.1 lipid asymmetry maintenance protein MlaB [Providencia rettgeri]EJD6047598.1 lipid asymmetry maintenance protein MlaB [Providencia rettgeri]EJD6376102.1 lipid asymmetry maintenance protein MlaB [Providencia rettgeri]